jgi:hypothetical protein
LNKKSATLIVLAPLLLAFAYYTLVRRIEPFMYQFYLMAWWSFICFLDAILALGTTRFLVLNRHFAFLVTMSAAFWCIFEMVNGRLQNWFYINIPQGIGFRFAGYFLAFGTVIPAIRLSEEQLERILPDIKVRPLSLKGYPKVALPLGLACLTLALVFPVYCFALAWVFLAFIIDGFNYRRGYPSFAGDIERGDLKPMLAAGLAGMICGFLWEFWNYWSIAKWVYTVPFFEGLKIFEMPAPGFLGFAFFALGTMAFLALLRSSPILARSKWPLSVLALIFCFVSFLLIDHYTVFSYTARVDQLPFLSDNDRAAIEATGARTSYAIDPRLLGREERERLALLQLKGLGLRGFNALDQYGVDTVARLSELDQNELSSILQERNMRRVKVYLKAAKEWGHAKQP